MDSSRFVSVVKKVNERDPFQTIRVHDRGLHLVDNEGGFGRDGPLRVERRHLDSNQRLPPGHSRLQVIPERLEALLLRQRPAIAKVERFRGANLFGMSESFSLRQDGREGPSSARPFLR
jgi:hypothetical protein